MRCHISLKDPIYHDLLMRRGNKERRGKYQCADYIMHHLSLSAGELSPPLKGAVCFALEKISNCERKKSNTLTVYVYFVAVLLLLTSLFTL